MSEKLVLRCSNYLAIIGSFNTSQVNTINDKRMIDINLRSVMATISSGGGLTNLRNICTNFDIPRPITEKPYRYYLKFLEKKIVEDCKRSISGAALKIRKRMGIANAGSVVDISVSVDGSWQKRYGLNSLHGVVFAISIEHGLVLDYAVKSLMCFACKKTQMHPWLGRKNILQIVQLITKAVLELWRKMVQLKYLHDQSTCTT